jgi:hypothetical protein
MAIKHSLETNVINVTDLLRMQKLSIPVYQRPYKWQEQHMQQLIEDIFTFKDKSAYRLGTIVIHNDDGQLNIVDGQQRTISCILLFKSIINTIKIQSNELKREVEILKNNLPNFEFSNPISLENIKLNYNFSQRAIASYDDEFVRFFLKKCEFIYFEVEHITEAFQFFDSQNARGKDLEPHDLLKAYHLREYTPNDEDHKLQNVTSWEQYQSLELSQLFSQYLFRIRSWAKGHTAQEFTKSDIYLFKGVSVEKIENYTYADSLRILHYFTDEFNRSYHRKIDLVTKSYPFQLDAPIINGRRFFEMIGHYKKIFNQTLKEIENETKLNDISREIFKVIYQYDGWRRTGDTYVRTLFECALIFYVDKFGFHSINQAIEKIFAWAYKIRLQYYAIQFMSVDNYVLSSNLFEDIKNSYTPNQALSRKIDFDIRIQRQIKELTSILSQLYYL